MNTILRNQERGLAFRTETELGTVFEFNFNEIAVRAFIRDDEAWFVAKDLCKVLEIENSRSAVGILAEDEKGVAVVDTPGGAQKMQIVSESGFYALVFKSRKAEAQKFRRWVTKEVLPSLREKGVYEMTTPLENVSTPLSNATSLPIHEGKQTLERVSVAVADVGYGPPFWRLNVCRRVRELAHDLGIPEVQVPDPEFGVVYAWPPALYELACKTLIKEVEGGRRERLRR